MLYTCKLHAARACRDDGSCGCSNTPFDPFDPSTPTPTPTPTLDPVPRAGVRAAGPCTAAALHPSTAATGAERGGRGDALGHAAGLTLTLTPTLTPTLTLNPKR